MRFGCLAIALAMIGCGNDGVHHLPDGPGGSGSGGSGGLLDGGGDGGGDGSGSGSGGIDAAPAAVGCDMTEIAAQCPATITGSTTNTAEPGPFAMTLSGTAYSYENTTNGMVMYPYDRHFTLSCTTMPDTTRAWAGGFHDDCYALNSIGNFTVDHTGASFDTKVGRCPPYATYTITSITHGGGDSGTCEEMGDASTLTAAP